MMFRWAVACAGVAFPGTGGVEELGRDAANVLVLTFVYLAVRWCRHQAASRQSRAISLLGTCRG